MSAQFGPHLYCEDGGDDSKDLVIESANEVFEIEDFTCPSPWEKFVARLEQILREWGLHSPSKSNEYPTSRKAEVEFNGFSFIVEYIRCPDETKYPCASFPTGSHPIQYFFGVNEFVVISPNPQLEKESINNETRSKMVMSTATVALHNTGCRHPIFVQVMEKEKSMYLGVGASASVKTNYDMIVLTRKPPNCNHLSGLLGMFKAKIRQPYRLDIPGVRVTARCKYALEDFTCHSWSQLPPDLDDTGVFKAGVSTSDIVPFGSACDPVKRLILFTTWSDLPEDIITDNNVHSDLDPLEAPAWSVGVNFEDGRVSCLLSEFLAGFTSLVSHTESIKALLGDFVDCDRSEEATAALHRLTGPSYTLSDILQSGRSSRPAGGPIRDSHLTQLLTYLFPDSSSSSETNPYPDQFTGGKSDVAPEADLENEYKAELSGVKSCPPGGLLWRLTLALAHCQSAMGGIKPFAHLLHEFLLEIRFRWETGHMIPGLPRGQPDHGYCLLHQKLQMVNCCISKKISREKTAESSREKTAAAEGGSAAESTDEEEFFECCDDEDDVEDQERAIPVSAPTTSAVPEWDRDPHGRLEKFGNIKLLERPDEQLYVPECQDPSPMTEDMLAEQAEIMLQLGMDAEGSAMRAKMQSAALLSDMESFKAANPGCTLGDFVRWHSPRDWEEKGNGKGDLSARMKTDGNVWLEVWKCAKPVPAKRQKRLFDDTREAEKCLQYFTSLKAGQVSDMLAPVLMHAAICRTLKEDEGVSAVKDGQILVRDAIKKLSHASRLTSPSEIKHFAVPNQLAELEEDFAKRVTLINEVAKLLRVVEVKVSRFYSLRVKFQCVSDNEYKDSFLSNLYANPSEVQVLGSAKGPLGTMVQQMFKDAKCQQEMIVDDEQVEALTDIFPPPISREFLLKTVVGRPYPYSQPSPQQFYCCLKDSEFRVAGAFSVDNQFL